MLAGMARHKEGAVREEHRIAERQRIARQVHASRVTARETSCGVPRRASSIVNWPGTGLHSPPEPPDPPSSMTQRVTDVNVNDVPEVQLAGSGLVSGGISGICKAHVDIAPSAFTSRL